MNIDRAHLHVVENFNTRQRNAKLNGLHHGIDSAGERLKAADRRRDLLRNAPEAQRHFGDDAERAFRADHQPREVVTRSTLARPPRGTDVAAVRRHHAQREDRFAHCAVAHRVGAGGTRRRHAAERCIRARIDREEEALVAQVRVQFFAPHAGLHRAIEVFRVHGQNPVHLGEIDHHPAAYRHGVAFNRSARAIRHNRHTGGGASLHKRHNLFGCVRVNHRVRQRDGKVRLARAVLCPHRFAEMQAITEDRSQALNEAWCEGNARVEVRRSAHRLRNARSSEHQRGGRHP